jgi:voltage-gated sodium channel
MENPRPPAIRPGAQTNHLLEHRHVTAFLARILADSRTEKLIIALILINAVTLGLETSPALMAAIGPVLHVIDKSLLAVFVLELAAKLVVHRLSFFKDPWNIFDFVVVAIALVPASGPLSVLRALRVLRVLRLVTVVPSLKRVVNALLGALPGMGSIILLLGLIFYVGSVMSTKLFGASFPEQFGTLWGSAYTLFQVMTLEGWSDGVVRPIMAQYPYAWVFFIPFILLTSFMALNLFIGVVVQAMQDEVTADAAQAVEEAVERADEPLVAELRALREEIARLANVVEGR